MIGERVTFFSMYQKDNNQNVNNYRPISLLFLCLKVYEKSIFDATIEYIVENNFLSSTQPGFKPNDSCNNQLISITHNIFSAFIRK